MIQANELRIGNWVEKFTDLGYSLGYSTVLPKEFLAIHTKPERVKPIPLTEEILLKCGFEEEDYDYEGCKMFSKNGFYILMDGDLFRYSIYGCLLDRNSDVKYFDVVDHLHTLQNIFYYTQFEELNIQL